MIFDPETGRLKVISVYPQGHTRTSAEVMAKFMDAELRIKGE